MYLRVLSRGTCYCPSRLDFHPYTQLVRAICRSATVRSSTHLSTGFNLARHRSRGFRSSTIDSKRAHFVPHSKLLRTCRFPFGFGGLPLNLAIDQNSLGHFSKRTTGRCSYHRFVSLYPTGFTFFSHPAKDTFQLSLTLLVNYRSRVVFRIGSICLPHSHAISNACYSLTVTWSYHIRLRDFHPLWLCRSRQLHLL